MANRSEFGSHINMLPAILNDGRQHRHSIRKPPFQEVWQSIGGKTKPTSAEHTAASTDFGVVLLRRLYQTMTASVSDCSCCWRSVMLTSSSPYTLCIISDMCTHRRSQGPRSSRGTTRILSFPE